MRVLVLGQRGMLGHVVVRYLREVGHEVIEGGRYDGRIELGDVEAVINCAGVVRGTDGLFLANALLPLHLAARLNGRLLVQPSTDCVFDGKQGWYGPDSRPDATDDYGLSKRLGEGCLAFPGVVVLRTSIVGPGGGLLGWFLGQPGPVEGWTDHVWNGITTLAWAGLAADALAGGIGPGLHQPTTALKITKYDLLRLFGEVFHHPIEVLPKRTGAARSRRSPSSRHVSAGPLDRSLAPTRFVPPLRDQLVALREWGMA